MSAEGTFSFQVVVTKAFLAPAVTSFRFRMNRVLTNISPF